MRHNGREALRGKKFTDSDPKLRRQLKDHQEKFEKPNLPASFIPEMSRHRGNSTGLASKLIMLLVWANMLNQLGLFVPVSATPSDGTQRRRNKGKLKSEGKNQNSSSKSVTKHQQRHTNQFTKQKQQNHEHLPPRKTSKRLAKANQKKTTPQIKTDNPQNLINYLKSKSPQRAMSAAKKLENIPQISLDTSLALGEFYITRFKNNLDISSGIKAAIYLSQAHEMDKDSRGRQELRDFVGYIDNEISKRFAKKYKGIEEDGKTIIEYCVLSGLHDKLTQKYDITNDLQSRDGLNSFELKEENRNDLIKIAWSFSAAWVKRDLLSGDLEKVSRHLENISTTSLYDQVLIWAKCKVLKARGEYKQFLVEADRLLNPESTQENKHLFKCHDPEDVLIDAIEVCIASKHYDRLLDYCSKLRHTDGKSKKAYIALSQGYAKHAIHSGDKKPNKVKFLGMAVRFLEKAKLSNNKSPNSFTYTDIATNEIIDKNQARETTLSLIDELLVEPYRVVTNDNIRICVAHIAKLQKALGIKQEKQESKTHDTSKALSSNSESDWVSFLNSESKNRKKQAAQKLESLSNRGIKSNLALAKYYVDIYSVSGINIYAEVDLAQRAIDLYFAAIGQTFNDDQRIPVLRKLREFHTSLSRQNKRLFTKISQNQHKKPLHEAMAIARYLYLHLTETQIRDRLVEEFDIDESVFALRRPTSDPDDIKATIDSAQKTLETHCLESIKAKNSPKTKKLFSALKYFYQSNDFHNSPTREDTRYLWLKYSVLSKHVKLDELEDNANRLDEVLPADDIYADLIERMLVARDFSTLDIFLRSITNDYTAAHETSKILLTIHKAIIVIIKQNKIPTRQKGKLLDAAERYLALAIENYELSPTASPTPLTGNSGEFTRGVALEIQAQILEQLAKDLFSAKSAFKVYRLGEEGSEFEKLERLKTKTYAQEIKLARYYEESYLKNEFGLNYGLPEKAIKCYQRAIECASGEAQRNEVSHLAEQFYQNLYNNAHKADHERNDIETSLRIINCFRIGKMKARIVDFKMQYKEAREQTPPTLQGSKLDELHANQVDITASDLMTQIIKYGENEQHNLALTAISQYLWLKPNSIKALGDKFFALTFLNNEDDMFIVGKQIFNKLNDDIFRSRVQSKETFLANLVLTAVSRANPKQLLEYTEALELEYTKALENSTPTIYETHDGLSRAYMVLANAFPGRSSEFIHNAEQHLVKALAYKENSNLREKLIARMGQIKSLKRIHGITTPNLDIPPQQDSSWFTYTASLITAAGAYMFWRRPRKAPEENNNKKEEDNGPELANEESELEEEQPLSEYQKISEMLSKHLLSRTKLPKTILDSLKQNMKLQNRLRTIKTRITSLDITGIKVDAKAIVQNTDQTIRWGETLTERAETVLDFESEEYYIKLIDDNINSLQENNQALKKLSMQLDGKIDFDGETYLKKSKTLKEISSLLTKTDELTKQINSMEKSHKKMIEAEESYTKAVEKEKLRSRRHVQTKREDRTKKKKKKTEQTTVEPKQKSFVKAERKDHTPKEAAPIEVTKKYAKKKTKQLTMDEYRKLNEIPESLLRQANDCILILENVTSDEAAGLDSAVLFQLEKLHGEKSDKAIKTYENVLYHARLYGVMKSFHTIGLAKFRTPYVDGQLPSTKACLLVRDSIMHQPNPASQQTVAIETLSKLLTGKIKSVLDQGGVLDKVKDGRINVLPSPLAKRKHPDKKYLLNCLSNEFSFLSEMHSVCEKIIDDKGWHIFAQKGFLLYAIRASIFVIGQALKDLHQSNQELHQSITKAVTQQQYLSSKKFGAHGNIFEELRVEIGHKFDIQDNTSGRYIEFEDVGPDLLYEVCQAIHKSLGAITMQISIEETGQQPLSLLKLDHWRLIRPLKNEKIDKHIKSFSQADNLRQQIDAIIKITDIIDGYKYRPKIIKDLYKACEQFLGNAKVSTDLYELHDMLESNSDLYSGERPINLDPTENTTTRLLGIMRTSKETVIEDSSESSDDVSQEDLSPPASDARTAAVKTIGSDARTRNLQM